MTQRRFDLDWLRITAFALLILYHCGMFYVTWDWHVKSSRASDTIEPLMMLTSPWRLSLLFLISGAATRFMADKMTAGAFVTLRMLRLWPPLLLGVFVVVPPQSYYEVTEALVAMGRPLSPVLDNFYVKYATASGGWCDADGCLTTPTYNHLWFVAYLILYTLALAALLPLLRRLPVRRLAWLLEGPGLFLTPWLFLVAARLTLFPVWGETHDFREDWYLHTVYLAVFLLGFAIAKHEPFFEAAVRMRWAALGIAVASWAALITYFELTGDGTPPEWLRMTFRAVREAEAWGAILAAIGFFHRHFAAADGPIRRTLSQAIFPFYIIHQTIIVVAGFYLDDLQLPLGAEAALLIAATGLGCWLFYELGRRSGPLRSWFGLPAASRVPARQPA
ncbi:MAG: acyltransferase [Hyphomonas sp.]|uniref:acyltransferase family protein n=1 Tax=Hyphomonas sp. TaxID=87 RepID=UPI00183A4A8F|nr:acyltransferase [Hyphomonas sp.]MBU3921354.1 acyltransferase [Alphaproteobacteria bacterium]MBA3070447.1 acyltransferase [Hyphomonas sp.]MBU4061761.1 acyltransferase [Alphaproteobacteria bacterium]MBU4164569.1 acyltransferase [Alphaproteobacteria bacterium]MBU4569220.1 acyltransferase [Alphaproteobacteria bacterium]